MVSQHQAVGRGIRARVQATIRIGGEQDRVGNLGCWLKRVSRPAVFLAPSLAQWKGTHDRAGYRNRD